MSKVLIIGGGAAGMFAACFAAENGCEVHLFEKNEKLGKKLFITGKGRCNLTNNNDSENFFQNVISNNKFLFSSYRAFDALSVMDFFEQEGLHLKTERGNRVFPISDHSSDVIKTLENAMKKRNVHIHLSEKVDEILLDDGHVSGIKLSNNKVIYGDYVLVATGGKSYASTGSTGDGYHFAKAAGHEIVNCVPSLVPFETVDKWPEQLMGLSLRNVSLKILQNNKQVYEEQGEMLFTHFGISGPLVLSGSAYLKHPLEQYDTKLFIDLKPALDEQMLDQRILRDFSKQKNKLFKNALNELLPSKLIPVIIELSKINPDKQINLITKEEREHLVKLLKHVPLTLERLRPFSEAIITKGGVSVKKIKPSTMESKLIGGLYFAGEVLDLDALTGGYNLQIAWSTAYAAATSMY